MRFRVSNIFVSERSKKTKMVKTARDNKYVTLPDWILP